MKKLPECGYVSFSFVADFFQTTNNTVHRWVREKMFPAPLYLSDGTSRFDVADIRAWIDERKKEQAELKNRRDIRNKLMVESRKRRAMEKSNQAA
ncbi:hypothetical protein K3N32_002594 [Salmonella enterica subsp. enterica serovar Kottbus]|nr:hypothetical protein [Salmonella enterica subsp. enterica serovar Kottbus]